MLAHGIVLLAFLTVDFVFGAAVDLPSIENQVYCMESDRLSSFDQFVKSDQDKNEYRLFTLPNQLRALIISAQVVKT